MSHPSTSFDGFNRDTTCVICRTEFRFDSDNHVTLKESGFDTLLESSRFHEDRELESFLSAHEPGSHDEVKVRVHVSCRKKYTDKRKRKLMSSENSDALDEDGSTSATVAFDRYFQCLFCLKRISGDLLRSVKKKNQIKVRKLTAKVQKRLVDFCDERADALASKVKERCFAASTSEDPSAASASAWGLFHRRCQLNFFAMKPIFGYEKAKKAGRPKDRAKKVALEKLFYLMKDSDKLWTLEEMKTKLKELGGDEAVYATKHLRTLLEDRFKDRILISGVRGRRNVFCFREKALSVINERWYTDQSANDDRISEEALVIAAAKRIRSEIRDMERSKNAPPAAEDVRPPEEGRVDYLPTFLKAFVENLISNENRQTALGFDILEAVLS